MDVQEQITRYLAAQPDPKSSELRQLHERILELMPGAKLWFLDGKDEKGKTASNPNIECGTQTSQLAGGKSREFYQIGLSANTAGISVYIMGLKDKTLLPRRFGKELGKASVTG